MESEKFCVDNYDCIGFDLDCTVAEYNVKELIKLIYNLLADFLVQKKSYQQEFFMKPFEEEEYFLQKGLFLDLKRGNILKIGSEGIIWRASHGTLPLTEKNIIEQYGPSKTCKALKDFINNPLSIINTPYEKMVRTSLDCFDMPCILLFARIIDHLDKINGEISKEYNIWPDILEGLYYLYSPNHFGTGQSPFFSELKKNPSKYYKKWDLEKMLWLKELKDKKFIFLLTGSFIDFASLTANTCIGENWKDYFHVILCYARKPFFFSNDKPFQNVDGTKETGAVEENGLMTNSVYSQGNWKELKALISKHTNNNNPKCLYIGDNLIQDVFAPVHFKCCDAIAVSTELKQGFGDSEFWGSYFEVNNNVTTYWNNLIKCHSKICISDLSILVKNPINSEYTSLKQGKTNEITESNGYYIK